MTVGGEFDPVVGDVLVDVAVFVAFALGVADEDDHLYTWSIDISSSSS